MVDTHICPPVAWKSNKASPSRMLRMVGFIPSKRYTTAVDGIGNFHYLRCCVTETVMQRNASKDSLFLNL